MSFLVSAVNSALPISEAPLTTWSILRFHLFDAPSVRNWRSTSSTTATGEAFMVPDFNGTGIIGKGISIGAKCRYPCNGRIAVDHYRGILRQIHGTASNFQRVVKTHDSSIPVLGGIDAVLPKLCYGRVSVTVDQ